MRDFSTPHHAKLSRFAGAEYVVEQPVKYSQVRPPQLAVTVGLTVQNPPGQSESVEQELWHWSVDVQ